MRKYPFEIFRVWCLLALLTACSSELKNNTVEITPEFILAVQKYDALGEFSEGLAPVGITEDGTRLWGYINTKGEEVIPCKIEALKVGCFSEGLACIVKDNKYSFIDHEGKIVFTINTIGATCNEEEVSFIVITKGDLPYFKDGECGLRFIDSDKVVYIDKNGKTIREEAMTRDNTNPIKGEYETFSEGEGYNSIGLKDKSGKVVIPAQYDDIVVGDRESGVFLAVIADKGDDDGMMPSFHVGYVDLKGNDTFAEQQKRQIQKQKAASPSAFAKAMKDAKWIETEQRFKYPDIMRKSITETEENLYEIYSYSWNKVELCWFWAGAWATEDIFFVKGEIAPDTRIREITYSSGDINELSGSFLVSGYTTDGRMFYLNRYIADGDIPHPNFLVLVYPEAFQKEVGPLIEIVRKWRS
jgi:hypothetical protein